MAPRPQTSCGMSQVGSRVLSLGQAWLAPGWLWESKNRYSEPTPYHHPHTHLSHISHVHTHTYTHPLAPHILPLHSGLDLHVCHLQPHFHPHKNSCVYGWEEGVPL